jgi:hypothetical protein
MFPRADFFVLNNGNWIREIGWDGTHTESDIQLEKAKNEVLRKIGRNMPLSQQLEQMRKYSIANGKVAGCASEIKANPEKRAAALNRLTTGVGEGR